MELPVLNVQCSTLAYRLASPVDSKPSRMRIFRHNPIKMNAEGSPKYANIRISGPISLERMVSKIPGDVHNALILILGPTGAGKSTFVEALDKDGSLLISSSQLEGFTQSISTYKVHNAITVSNFQIYVIDVPGFADTKISERRIVAMLKEWMEINESTSIGRILYLTPINAVRLPGSQRQILKTFRALTGLETSKNITIVSTMWDAIWGESATRRSESNFQQLKDEIWMDFINEGSQIVKFLNTHESALCILDDALGSFDEDHYFDVEDFVNESRTLQRTRFGQDLYNNLQMRAHNLQIYRDNLLLDIQSASVRANPELLSALLSQLGEVYKSLARFEQELDDFGPSPIFEDVIPTPPPPSHSGQNTPTPSPSKRARLAKALRSVKFWDKAGH